MTTYRQTRSRIIQKAAQKSIPVLGEFELTSGCNLACAMCFVRHISKNKDLTTKEWIEIFNEAVEEGLLFATLTGGEIFTRPDFQELYEHLHDQGVRITLFTNATLITEDVIQTLKKRPPEYVAVTLYGASRKTYGLITKDEKAFDKAKAGIHALKEAGLNVVLRTIPLQAIYDELDEMIDLLRSFELPVTYFLYVGPKRGETALPEERLPPEKLARYERRLREAFTHAEDETYEWSGSASTCAALKSAYFISHKGRMQPCAMAMDPGREITPGKLKETFLALSEELKAIEQADICTRCEMKSACITCFARRKLEGDAFNCHDYLLDFARQRKKVL